MFLDFDSDVESTVGFIFFSMPDVGCGSWRGLTGRYFAKKDGISLKF